MHTKTKTNPEPHNQWKVHKPKNQQNITTALERKAAEGSWGLNAQLAPLLTSIFQTSIDCGEFLRTGDQQISHTIIQEGVPILSYSQKGAQWLSGRVPDSRPRGRGIEHHWRHCVVFLSKNINPSLILV